MITDRPCAAMATIFTFFIKHPLIFGILVVPYICWVSKSCMADFMANDWPVLKKRFDFIKNRLSK